MSDDNGIDMLDDLDEELDVDADLNSSDNTEIPEDANDEKALEQYGV